jgi:hypothetical protein
MRSGFYLARWFLSSGEALSAGTDSLNPLRSTQRQSDLAARNVVLPRVDADEGATYASQNPCAPRKSGKPESTPMPAPAVTNSASAALMASAACLISLSVFAAIGQPFPQQLLCHWGQP